MGGSSSVLKWLTDLEAAGFITIIRNGANNRTSFRLRSEPYRTLCGVRNRTTDRSEIGQLTDPKSDHIEEHVEDQEKKTSSSTSSTETDEVFERFWKAYPRKTGTSKKKAASAFKSATKRGHLDQIRDGFKRDCAMWTRERRAPEHIPHAATWLNEERYMPETDAPMPSFAEAQQQTVRPRQIRPNGSVWELDDDGNEVCIFDPKASA
jgi:DNA-binding PadR family transcriptional regulator